jgi:hypothetical protein
MSDMALSFLLLQTNLKTANARIYELPIRMFAHSYIRSSILAGENTLGVF